MSRPPTPIGSSVRPNGAVHHGRSMERTLGVRPRRSTPLRAPAVSAQGVAMSISGMTGFARAEGEHAGQRWIWELKSVNGRGLDLKLRLPSGFDTFEAAARAAAGVRFKRGSLQATLTLARDAAAAPPVKVDIALV